MQNLDRPCGACDGTGRIPLNDAHIGALAAISKLSKRGRRCTVDSIYKAMPKRWRDRRSRSSVSSVLQELLGLGLVCRPNKEGRSYTWALVSGGDS